METIGMKVMGFVQSIKEAPVKAALIFGGVVVTGIVIAVAVKTKHVDTEFWSGIEPVVEQVAAVVEA